MTGTTASWSWRSCISVTWAWAVSSSSCPSVPMSGSWPSSTPWGQRRAPPTSLTHCSRGSSPRTGSVRWSAWRSGARVWASEPGEVLATTSSEKVIFDPAAFLHQIWQTQAVPVGVSQLDDPSCRKGIEWNLGRRGMYTISNFNQRKMPHGMNMVDCIEFSPRSFVIDCDFFLTILRFNKLWTSIDGTWKNSPIDFRPRLSLWISTHPGSASRLRSKIDSFQLDERIEAMVSKSTSDPLSWLSRGPWIHDWGILYLPGGLP